MSYWLEQLPNKRVQNTQQNLPAGVTDVVIIGSGITGASVAYHLAKNDPTLSCVLLDKGEISAGATGCNGGFICPGTSERFSASVKRYGLQITQELFDYTGKCTEQVKEYVETFNVDCEVRFHGSVLLALNEAELLEVRTSYEQLTSYGVPVQWWDVQECAQHTKSSSYLGGLVKSTAGNLWAAKLVHSLVDKAESAGVKIHPYTSVESVLQGVQSESHGGETLITVKTSRGELKTKKVVYCTNAWTRDLLPSLKEIIIPVRNQLIMTEPVERMWDFGLSTNFGYEYFMQRPDGRILLGGMRNLTPNMEVNCADPVTLNPQVSAALRSYLPKHFPSLRPCRLAHAAAVTAPVDCGAGDVAAPSNNDNTTHSSDNTSDKDNSVRIEHEWIGIMGFTPDRNPLVGPLATRPGEYVAAGYTGHGMPVAFLAGRNIADLICDVQSTSVRIPEAYSPARYNL